MNREQTDGRRLRYDYADPCWLANIRNLHGADLASPLDMNDVLRQRTSNHPHHRRLLRSQLSLRWLRRSSSDSTTSSLSSGSARRMTGTLEASVSYDQKPAARSDPATPREIMPTAVSKSSHCSVLSVSSNGFSNRKPAARCISLASKVQSPADGTRNIAPPQLPPQRFSLSNKVGKTIEITPGVILPLRDADETWECIKQDFFVPATCLSCTTEVCCIQDASFVLCPVCRVVSPLDCGNDCGAGGVGLGFTFDELFRWQSELLNEQRNRTQERLSPLNKGGGSF